MTELNYANKEYWEIRNYLIKEIFIMSKTGDLKALDQFGNQFILLPLALRSVNVLDRYIDDIINFYRYNTEMSIFDILLKSGVRFSVSDLRVAKHDTKLAINEILNIPPDIYRFLLLNNYDNELIETALNDTFYIPYNFVEIITKILKVGKDFKVKNNIINFDNDKASENILDYIKEKYTTRTPSILYASCKFKFGADFVTYLSNKCRTLDISFNNMIYRVHELNMRINDAIKIAITEKEKYDITFRTGYGSVHTFGLNEVFYNVAREYIKDLEDKEDGDK